MKACLWIVAFGVLTSCVDNEYNLGKVKTDGIVVGDEWVFPLGTVDVKVTDILDLDTDKVEGLKIAITGDYSVSYADELVITLPQSPNIPRHTQIPEYVDVKDRIKIDFPVGNLNNLMGSFGTDFILGLTNPHILLNLIGLKSDKPVDVNLRLTSSKQDVFETVIDSPFKLSEEKPKVWIGPLDPKDQSYTYVEQKELPKMVSLLPEKILLTATKFMVPIESEIGNVLSLGYEFNLPLIPSSSFRATAVQSMNNIFDKSMVDYLFSSGSATIYGTIQNELPFNAMITMSITDDQDEVLFSLPAQEVKGTGKNDVEFVITEKYIPKMIKARNIKLEFKLSGRPELDGAIPPASLNEKQTMKMELKLRKKGGIKVEA